MPKIPLNRRLPFPWQSGKGFALVLVLVVIAMAALLVVAFLLMARTEDHAASTFAWGSQTQLLADLPVNLVTAQIRKATETLGNSKTWASQPGAIRVYGTSGAGSSGRAKLDTIYKLYSAPKMVEGLSFDPANEVPSTDWATTTGMYCDLNEPVWVDRNHDGMMDANELVFPILDPRGAAPPVTGSAKSAIEGFSIEMASAGDAQAFGVVLPQNQNDVNARAPMPSRWIYVLGDGRLAIPQSQSGSVVSFTSDLQPSAKNPIVGRIAFWTDDETCKVNINTASEGVPWDVPHTNVSSDAFLFADKQPVRGEYSHYPGHPATVCLSPILNSWLPLRDYPVGDLAPLAPGVPPSTTGGNITGYRTEIARYYSLSPRIAMGGSNGGTTNVDVTTSPVTPDQTRMYATVDEMFFDPQRRTQPSDITALPPSALEEAKFFLTASSRAPEVTLFNTPRIALWPIQNSPLDRNSLDSLIAFCAQTRGQQATQPYYFQRQSVFNLQQLGQANSTSSSQSTKQDWSITRNQQLFAYLQRLTGKAVPGFSRNDTFAGKYPADRDQILTSMVDYLRSGLNTYAYSASPSGADAFATKRDARGYAYSPPRGLTTGEEEYGAGQVIPLRIGSNQGFGRSITVSEVALVLYPSQPRVAQGKPDARVSVPGSSNRPALSAAAMRAFLLIEFFCASPGNPSWSPYLRVSVDGLDTLQVDGKSLNFPNATNGKGPTVLMHTPIDHIPFSDGTNSGAGNSSAHFALFQPLFQGGRTSTATPRNVASADPMTGFAWHSQSDIPLDPPDSNGNLHPMQLTSGGSQNPVVIHLRTVDDSEEIQTININFQPCSVPMPYIYIPTESGFVPQMDQIYTPALQEYSLQSRLAYTSDQFCVRLIRPGDVVRSMEAAMTDDPSLGSLTPPVPKGDLRFYAARQTVPWHWFTEGGQRFTAGAGVAANSQWDYYRAGSRFAHGLRNGTYWQYWGHFAGLSSMENADDAIGGEGSGDPNVHPYYRMASATVAGSLLPCIVKSPSGSAAGQQVDLYRDPAFVCARGITAAYRADGKLGDFDNGMGNLEDGCYINQPDGCNSYTTAQAAWAPFVDGGGYYSRGAYTISGASALNHSPNRQIASAVAFGSLPSGLHSNHPWETLLFCPNPAGRTTPAFQSGQVVQPSASDHRGFGFPRDHLLADLFWMPVVEPYAISEPFSTGGKINLNYDILPFRYLKRRTALHSVLKSAWLTAMPAIFAQSGDFASNFGCYKGGRNQPSREAHYAINLDHLTGTLAAFEDRFNREKDLFHSATEICEVFLIPKYLPGRSASDYPDEAQTLPSVGGVDPVAWWIGKNPNSKDGMKLTGDNAREAPYAQILPRVTTKSNTYTVHYQVQALQKARSTDPTKWDDSLDQMRGSQRGSVLLERYIDPNDPQLPDFAANSTATATAVDNYYRIRILRKRVFSP